MMDLDIRLWRQEDLPAIRELLSELVEVTHGPEPDLSLDHLTEIFGHMERFTDFYLNLVATCEGDIAGFLSIVFYRSLFHRAGTALVSELVVGRRHRDRGVGRMLIERAKEEAQSRGLDELEVSTETDNQDARTFYRRCGFDEEHVLLGMEFGSGANEE
ncbi:hypothetical protein AMJ39_06695 [candidate division TA06 bacterium DG_24]|uniref:N-acetyltransferase domain-containing protein n=2 Tax=Bacteria division TA06 TaxID=1156500 RepID=A0A0S8GCM4_UNCT6|nr:MAG: hypothetical protein AMJ39_06695 [candidate division TA06 bacterium DG_24]KPK70489.1 MAG: hypothetical protein AMJ82_03225 [candidate division TA06 bacterium SM23_40]